MTQEPNKPAADVVEQFQFVARGTVEPLATLRYSEINKIYAAAARARRDTAPATPQPLPCRLGGPFIL